MPTTEPTAGLPQVAPHIAQIIRDFARETRDALTLIHQLEQVHASLIQGTVPMPTIS